MSRGGKRDRETRGQRWVSLSDENEARGEEKKRKAGGGGRAMRVAGDGVLVSIFIRTFGAFIATSSQRQREREGEREGKEGLESWQVKPARILYSNFVFLFR